MLISKSLLVKEEDWEFLITHFRAKGYRPRTKIAEILEKAVVELREKELEEKLNQIKEGKA